VINQFLSTRCGRGGGEGDSGGGREDGVMNERGQTQGQRPEEEALGRGSWAPTAASGRQGNIITASTLLKSL